MWASLGFPYPGAWDTILPGTKLACTSHEDVTVIARHKECHLIPKTITNPKCEGLDALRLPPRSQTTVEAQPTVEMKAT